MSALEIRPIVASDEAVIAKLLCEHWGDRKVVSRSKVYDAATLPGFLAFKDEKIVGLVTLRCEEKGCEVVTLDAYVPGLGIGTCLIKEAELFAASHGCKRLWLITTNDNLGALTFYQKRGFRIIAVHIDAVGEARKIKPQIPDVAENGIEIRDEIELQKILVLE